MSSVAYVKPSLFKCIFNFGDLFEDSCKLDILVVCSSCNLNCNLNLEYQICCSCECPSGFEGARCQQLSHSFDGTGWAWYSPLSGCEDDVLSLEFATEQSNGLILYNGKSM